VRQRAARRALKSVALVALLVACDRPAPWRDDFAGGAGGDPTRWCERYHHAHVTIGGIRVERSERSDDACTSGGGRSCRDAGCDACLCDPPCSPCAKVADPQGNAVLMTSSDAVGTEREATARFTIERQLPVDAHVGLYVAIHPHCHTTVQGLLVADAPGEFHLNVAASNQFIGGRGPANDLCRVDPVADISAALAERIALEEGRSYAWRLTAALAERERIDVTTELRDATGRRLASARHVFRVPGAWRWFGVAGGAARYAFGAQYTLAPSPSGGDPALLLESFSARP
jgi:hypothetical protein